MSLAFRVAELERRLACLVRLGTVAALDAAAARVQVRSGALTTAWLPWLTRRAGPDADWWAPEPGEQVVLLAPGGDLAQAVVLPALYQAAYPAPAGSADVARVVFADGGSVTYDRAAGVLDVVAVARVRVTAPEVEVVAADRVRLDTPLVEVTGQLTVAGTAQVTGALSSATAVSDPTGTMQAMRGTYNAHTHPENGSGGGTTSAPTQPM